MLIKNQKEFDSLLQKQLVKCVSYISDLVLETVKQHIIDDVYFADPTGNKYYNNGTKQPTWEFFDSFQLEGIKKGANEISNLLFYNWITMSPPSQDNPYLHGNFQESIDRRERLADILNVVGTDSFNDWGGKKRNAFWDNTIREIESNFDKWAKEAYEKYLK